MTQRHLDSVAARLRPCFDPSQTSPHSLTPETFQELALDLFEAQFQAIEPYRRYCEALGRGPRHVGDWEDIPCVSTLAFRDYDLSSISAEDRVCCFCSSGTTTQARSRHHHSAASLELYRSAIKAWFHKHLRPETTGAPGSTHLLSLVPSADEAPQSSLAYMLQTLAEDPTWTRVTIGCQVHSTTGSWETMPNLIVQVLEDVRATKQPLLLVGTAFSLVHMLETLERRGTRYSLAAGSRLMETGGYKGRSRELPKPELYRRLTEWLGLPTTHIVAEYGMAELSSQAYDRIAASNQPRRFRFPPWCRTRIVSPETGDPAPTGEPGLLQVFDLANVYSVMALQTEDLVVAREDGFEYLGRASSAEARGCSLMHA